MASTPTAPAGWSAYAYAPNARRNVHDLVLGDSTTVTKP
jgi:hypothetical protein